MLYILEVELEHRTFCCYYNLAVHLHVCIPETVIFGSLVTPREPPKVAS